MRVRSLPKVFHTCGKNCGKSAGFVGLAELPDKSTVILVEREHEQRVTGLSSRRDRGYAAGGWQP
jgi:hypothetical protein